MNHTVTVSHAVHDAIKKHALDWYGNILDDEATVINQDGSFTFPVDDEVYEVLQADPEGKLRELLHLPPSA
jgi:hypothetical protein